jgi:peptide/nickel transport system ATP-binding protein/oligopeptide transport system ATP-binding protein
MEELLSVKNLSVEFETRRGLLRAVNGVSFDIMPRTTLGLVGESGCGKTVTCLSILKLIEEPGKIIEGSVIFEGKNILEMDEEDLRHIRGKEISFVFQEPMTSLNPVLTIGEQVMETILAHRKIKKKEAKYLTINLLEKVKMPSPEDIIYQYPHNLSGGMRQRAMIAFALACNPKLLIADEPTTALDVTIQAQILDLLQSLREEFNMSLLIVTHDFGIIAKLTDFVAVMYAGQIVEYTETKIIFKNPKHPYTKGLLSALPRARTLSVQGLPQASKKFKLKRLKEIPGSLPDLTQKIKGCLFYPRCPRKEGRCLETEPFLKEVEVGQWVRCWKY